MKTAAGECDGPAPLQVNWIHVHGDVSSYCRLVMELQTVLDLEQSSRPGPGQNMLIYVWNQRNQISQSSFRLDSNVLLRCSDQTQAVAFNPS